MKFYVLKHPEKGYLRSKEYYKCSWTNDIEKAKKWNFRNHIGSMQTQTSRSELKEGHIEEIHYWIVKEVD